MWDISDYDAVFIEVDMGWETILINKLSISQFIEVDGDYCTITYTNTEDDPSGLQRKIVFDYNETTIAGLPPSNATEIKTAINNFIRSGFSGGSGGDVVGPASAVNNNLPAFDGTTGKLLKDSGDSVASIKAYADSLVVGLWDDRGSFDASGGAYPSSGGSGTAGAILKGDIWTISVAGTLPTGQVVEIGDVVRALINTPGNTQGNWAITQNNIGYVAENAANKSTDVNTDQASNTKYPSVKAVYDWAVALFTTTAAVATQITTALTGYLTAATAAATYQPLGAVEVFATTDLSKASDNTYANDPVIQFPVVASKKYYFRMELMFHSAAAADFKFQLVGPASPTLVYYYTEYNIAGGNTLNPAILEAYSVNRQVLAAVSGACHVNIYGVFHNGSNAGTVALQWAQVTSDLSVSIRLAGSKLLYKQVD